MRAVSLAILGLMAVVACQTTAAAADPTYALSDGPAMKKPLAYSSEATVELEPIALPLVVNNCVRCHATVGGIYSGAVADFAGSVHDRAGMACDTCHGGSTTDDESAHVKGGYIGTHPSKTRERCIACHESEAKFYGQGAHYRERYDWRFPNCYDCHGAHGIGNRTGRFADACTVCHGARARAEIGTGESGLIWKSPREGARGNRIAITLLAEVPNQKLSVDLSSSALNTEVVVHLSTNRHGVSTTLAEELIALVGRTPTVASQVHCEEADGFLGLGIVASEARFTLKGGADFDAAYPAYRELIHMIDKLGESIQEVQSPPAENSPVVHEVLAESRVRTMVFVHNASAIPDPEAVSITVDSMRRLDARLRASQTNQ